MLATIVGTWNLETPLVLLWLFVAAFVIGLGWFGAQKILR